MKNTILFREFTGNNIPILHRIFVRIQGATMDEYWTYSSIVATQNTEKKTSTMGRLFFATSLTYAVIFLAFLYLPANAAAKAYKTIAILPFEINAPGDISHIRTGMESMLYSRLYWKDKTAVIDSAGVSHMINNSIKNQKIKNPSPEQIASILNSDYVLTAYITQFSKAFSIDVRVYDTDKQQWINFSEQSGTMDSLIRKINIIAAKINKKLFNREGTVYDKLVKKEKAKKQQWKLQNPMDMMPVVPDEEKTEKKSSFWRFWE